MIHVVFSGPCVYNPRQRGMADVMLTYTGESPERTAMKFIAAHPGFRLYTVVKDGHVYFDSEARPRYYN